MMIKTNDNIEKESSATEMDLEQKRLEEKRDFFENHAHKYWISSGKVKVDHSGYMDIVRRDREKGIQTIECEGFRNGVRCASNDELIQPLQQLKSTPFSY